jgi:hypothetical protein
MDALAKVILSTLPDTDEDTFRLRPVNLQSRESDARLQGYPLPSGRF